MESSDKAWSIGEGNGKLLQYSCLENPMNSMERQNDRIPEEKQNSSFDCYCDPVRQETWVQSLGWEAPLEKVMATHSSILAWREEPSRLQSMGSQRVGHD